MLFLSSVIVFRSLTEAQRALSALKRGGISAILGKPSAFLGKGSCAHGLKVSHRELERALRLLDARGMGNLSAYDLLPDGRTREVRL